MKNSFAWFSILLAIIFATDLRAQTDSISPYDIATGHSYFGIDLGLTGSDYLGAHNFLWGIVTDPTLATYLPFTSLGTGIGVVGGVKVAFAVAHWVDIEAKLRLMTNYTSRTESSPDILLDPYVPAVQAPATSTYSLMLSSIGGALLGHIRLNDWLYGAVGGSASDQTKNGFSASQHVSTSYVRLNTHTVANVQDQSQPEEQINNWFYSFRADAQVGAGAVFRLGSSNMLLDAELLVGIPLTRWLTPLADSSLRATDSNWHQPLMTDPHLWYATLTVGLRLPFEKLPVPIPPVAVETPGITPDIHISTTPPHVNGNGSFVLSGKVTDSTGKPIAANITTVNLGDNNVVASATTDANGDYHITVKGGGKYSVTASAPGYLFGSALFEVDSQGRILSNDSNIVLAQSGAGAKTRLLVFFEFDKADLQPASMPELNHALDLMKQVPSMRVEIAGYTDTVGTLAHNMDLSLRRANAVRDYLVQQGVAADRITAKGYGPSSPVASNETDEGRAKNRRVEFVVEGQ